MSEAGDRYVVITPDNQSANIWVSALISVGVASSCVGVRIISRAKIGFKFGIDDYVFAVAWGIQVLQVGPLLKATALGLGKNDSIIDQSHASSIQTYTAASTILTVLAIFLTKVSMMMLTSRLFNRRLWPYWVGIAVFGVIAAIEIEANCTYPTCTNVRPRYFVLAAFDIVTEIIVVALPIYCIQEVRMSRKRKAKVLATFSARVTMIVFAGLVIWSATRIKETGKYSTSVVLTVIILQLELGLSLVICAVIPCFRMIFQSSDIVFTDSGNVTRETKREDSHRGSNHIRSFSRPTDGTQTDTQISYVRQPTPPPPTVGRKPEHSAQSSEDTSGGRSYATEPVSTGDRASENSLVPSATTGLSGRRLV